MNKNHKKLQMSDLRLAYCLLLILFCMVPIQTNAQDCTPTKIHTRDGGNNDSGSDNGGFGQSFTACADVEIISIRVTANSTAVPTIAGTYNLYIHEEIGGAHQTTTPLATVTFNSAPTSLQIITFDLDVPFVTSDGTTYRFVVKNEDGYSAMRISTTNDFGGGSQSLVFSSGFAVSSYDLDFEIITQDITPPPTPTVPTLSEWGLIVLALLLMISGTLYLLNPKINKRVFEK